MAPKSVVGVIGACGHVGLPFSLVIASSGHFVYGFDVHEDRCAAIQGGAVPYIEHGAKELLDRALAEQSILFTTDTSHLKECHTVVIMLGTPVDAENNPRFDDLFNFTNSTLIPGLRQGQLIVLRCTVSPGTTQLLRDHIEERTGKKEGVDFHLVFCPERVAQSYGIQESTKFPQLVGAFSRASFEVAEAFYNTFVTNDCMELTPREAELGKLVTNVYRYVNFALANEFYMIADRHGCNIDKIITACNKGRFGDAVDMLAVLSADYGRLNIPKPGPNVGGPCLYKDGRFLLGGLSPFADLFQVSFMINEGMPEFIFDSIKAKVPVLKRLAILGMTFKAECDDDRNSLSFKFRKICRKHGVVTDCFDPFWAVGPPENKYGRPGTDWAAYGAVVVMTPHKAFVELYSTEIKGGARDECIIGDAWKLLPDSKQTTNGIYRLADVRH